VGTRVYECAPNSDAGKVWRRHQPNFGRRASRNWYRPIDKPSLPASRKSDSGAAEGEEGYVYNVGDISREFMGHNFVPGLRTLGTPYHQK